MNRKNLTAAVLAGLAGIAGIAGTAQAVNLNPDGLGQVLIYPYYTTNGGNQTVLSVVNTTNAAKAVKVRFLEGYNSREVLDFNLYMSAFDVWVAAIADDEGVPTLYIPDNSCTVPYLYGNAQVDPHTGAAVGEQVFLTLAYNDIEDPNTGESIFSNDGGPTDITRASEGHFEMIEMGTLVGDSAADATHGFVAHDTGDEDDDGNTIFVDVWEPADCDQLVANWTRTASYGPLGMWTFPGDADIDINRNSGGMFGGAAIVNSENGTMYSYDAKAIQGYDKSDGQRHEEPGTTEPGLNSGDQHRATIFFGVPSNRAVDIWYPRSVGAISALFMHENIMNEFTLNEDLAASTEWVVTFPTKNFYVDTQYLEGTAVDLIFWDPDPLDPGCGGWMPGDDHPLLGIEGLSDPNPLQDPPGWELCTFIDSQSLGAIPPFTDVFDGEACETAGLTTWDRDERSFEEDRDGTRPPVVSPSVPGLCDPEIQFCESVTFQFCYEVNVMRFGEGVIFGTTSDLLLSVSELEDAEGDPIVSGWGRINFNTSGHQDRAGLVGLPVTGFSAFEFENNFVGDADVKAFYGGLFGHKGNVRRTTPLFRDQGSDG